jgi:hypothetical protein
MSNKSSLLGNRGFKGPQGFIGPQGDKGDKGDKGLDNMLLYWQLNSSSNTLSPINNYSINKSNIAGIENVYNTSDLNKQISTSTQAALDLKANKTYVHEKIQELIVDNAPSELDTLNEIANSLNNDSHLATTLTNSIELKASKISPTFTGTVSGITSDMIKPNNIVINSSDLDSNGNFILNSNNFKDGCSIISTSISSTISSPSLGNGLNNYCWSICEIPNSKEIYIGGDFTSATNSDGTVVTVNRICKYNTISGKYTAVGNGLNNHVRTIYAMPNSTDIYIGGSFTNATNSNGTVVSVNRICKYNTENGYTALGQGLNNSCWVICAVPNSTDIYIGGAFTTATNSNGTVVSVNRICKYNTVNGYTALRPGLNNSCWTICPSNDLSNNIYIGGDFTGASNNGTTNIPGTTFICKYNTVDGFSAVGNGLNGYIRGMKVVENSDGSTDVYSGGNFTTAYNTGTTNIPGTTYICKYNTKDKIYSAVGNGLNQGCWIIYSPLNSSDIYIGGPFTSAYNTGTNNISGTSKICKYNTITKTYYSLGAGLNDSCTSIYIASESNNVYIGGGFTSIVYLNNYSLSVNCICKLNNIQIYYKNTLISSINYQNPFEVIQKNTIDSKEYITLVCNNKRLLI